MAELALTGGAAVRPQGYPAWPVHDERDGLLSYLRQMRLVMRLTAYGLTDDQARATPTVSALSVGGLIKHVAEVEEHWADFIVNGAGDQGPPDAAAMEKHANGFRMLPGETLQSILDRYEQVSSRTNDPRSAQQMTALLILPVTVVFVAQLMGLMIVGSAALLMGALACLLLNIVLLWVGVRVFERESILTRWR